MYSRRPAESTYGVGAQMLGFTNSLPREALIGGGLAVVALILLSLELGFRVIMDLGLSLGAYAIKAAAASWMAYMGLHHIIPAATYIDVAYLVVALMIIIDRPISLTNLRQVQLMKLARREFKYSKSAQMSPMRRMATRRPSSDLGRMNQQRSTSPTNTTAIDRAKKALFEDPIEK